jgi:(1->4)-alpha-D-glucan 1-alpha-D-glucosylmutase
VLRTVLGSDLHRLTDLLSRVSRADWPHRDYPWSGLRKLLLEILVEFPVYREYPERASVELSQSRPEGRYAREAVASARGRNPELDSRLLDFVGALLTKPQSDPLPQEFGQRFYQLSAPAMAKGAEDTAFYMYNRLIALNEVGGDPGRFGIDLRTWHDACSSTAAVRPQTLLASATHDTKRGEDTRARLTLLAQAPERWQRAVEQLARCADAYRSKCAAGVLPDANTEYFLYQTLIGVWPVETERLSEYMLKAVREAKVHTCWLRPVEEYEQGLKKFITAVMADVSFRQVVGDLVAELNEPARIVGLAQTLIKLTAPGVPDIYQGTELWHHVLVDPDNRRPVDFSERERLLQESVQLDAAGTLARGYMGLTKMRVLRLTLACRRRFADAFAPGARYACVKVHGRDADAVVAYERGERIAVLVPRFPLRYPPEAIEATADLAHGSWSAIFSDEEFDGGRIDLKRLWRNFPVALLVRN